MTGRTHIKFGVFIALGLLMVFGMMPAARNVLSFIAIVGVSVFGSIAPDMDTWQSLSYYKNPVARTVSNLVRLVLVMAIITLLGYLVYRHTMLSLTLAEAAIYFGALLFLLFVVILESSEPVISYLIFMVMVGLLLIFAVDGLWPVGVIMLAIAFSGHRNLTHSLDFFLLMGVLMYFFVPKEYQLYAISYIAAYGTHLVLDMLSGQILVSIFLPVISLGKVPKWRVGVPLVTSDFDEKVFGTVAVLMLVVTMLYKYGYISFQALI